MNLMYFNKRERDIIWKYQLDQMNQEVEKYEKFYFEFFCFFLNLFS